MEFQFEDFDLLRQLIYETSGIWLSDRKQTFLSIRLNERMRAGNISSAREYLHFLKYDPNGAQETRQLIDAVAVNETWFFREVEPIRAWFQQILPGLLATNGGARLWSAGCATGEEPYTLAMLALESQPQARAKIDIWATDISQRALEMAQRGMYDPHATRHTEANWLAKYFQPTQNGFKAISAQARQLVRFERHNLIDPHLPARARPVDVILCRNVIIYFDQKSRQAALNNFDAILKPGGYLLLGHSESLAQTATPFELTRIGDKLVYHKPK